MNKKHFAVVLIVLAVCLLLSAWAPLFEEEFIAVYDEDALQTLLTNCYSYQEKNEELLDDKASDRTEELFDDSIEIAQYVLYNENSDEQDVDNAYRALYHSFILVGMEVEWQDKYDTDKNAVNVIGMTAFEEIDQEYYDLLDKKKDVTAAEKIREEIEELYEDPDDFSKKDTKRILGDTLDEICTAARMKARYYLNELPPVDGPIIGMPNPMVQYRDVEPLSEMLGYEMPELADFKKWEDVDYYIIDDDLAQIDYESDDEELTLRVSPGDYDTSGVYGAKQIDEYTIEDSLVVVSKYEEDLVAVWTIEGSTGGLYSCSIVSDDLSEKELKQAVEEVIDAF